MDPVANTPEQEPEQLPPGVSLVLIEDEMHQSYLDYAMSVIVGRALPDARDGLKPVHRRVLHAMNILGNHYNSTYKKSARVVGDVIGKFHPHGDSAVYETIVRMAQPFSMRYMLVDGQGNFGSVDGDSAAAMRYTEVRMAKITEELLADLDKDTVDFVPNYDGTETIPDVLPNRIPNLLVNGSSGIAVGMATNIPPHNLGEVVSACLAMIDKPNITDLELIQYVRGPDFPTAGIINGTEGIVDAYTKGRGRIHVRAKTSIEVDEKRQKSAIIIHELPYQVNKARLIEKIAELVRERRVEEISGVRDESDKDGMRVVIDIKRSAEPEVVLNNLYTLTQLQVTFGVNMVALVDGQPKLLTLGEALRVFLNHRRVVVTRRTVFDIAETKKQMHILAGLLVATLNIDKVIDIIRKSQTSADAKLALQNMQWQAKALKDFLPGVNNHAYVLSAEQAQAILDLRLARLTGLEQAKLKINYRELMDKLHQLQGILDDSNVLMNVIRGELHDLAANYNDPRRTVITEAAAEIRMEDCVVKEDVVVTMTHKGYVKYQPVTGYDAQRRGGKGKTATKTSDEDVITQMLTASTHDTLLCFSNRGVVYWLKVYELPDASRAARGKPINNLLPLGATDRITAILPVSEYDPDHSVLMATASGMVKKTALTEFNNPRSKGIIAVGLKPNDELIGVDLVVADDEAMLFSTDGKVARFPTSEVREMGRTASGVKGLALSPFSKAVTLLVPRGKGDILTVTRNGYGKRTSVGSYPTKSRATKGVISIKTTDRNGAVIGATQVQKDDDILMITKGGMLIRTNAEGVNKFSRNTAGVSLIKLADNDEVVGLERVIDVQE